MLKVFLGFGASVVVLLVGASIFLDVSKAHAASTGVLITQIQAGGIGAASKEYIVIYNNSAESIAISGWCLRNKSSVTIACFNAPTAGQAVYLPPHSHAVAASSLFVSTTTGSVPTTTYVPANLSSGSITGAGDTILLVDRKGVVVDQQAWTTPLAAGMQFERQGTGLPITYLDSRMPTDWKITLPGPLPRSGTELDTTIADMCPNIEGIQVFVPIGKQLNVVGECLNLTAIQLAITEILPNAIGSDEGKEFIELYNPSDEVIDLADYVLYVGISYEGSYEFPQGSSIEPHSYRSFFNNEIPFTLLNSSSLVMIALRDGSVISEIAQYRDPKEGESWALIDEQWQYSNYPTPSVVNTLLAETAPVATAMTELQPCATNQYRSLETNRCRLIIVSPTATPCKDGQYRSEATNRCRNIAADTNTISDCKENEERNPQTNRCRKIVTTSAAAVCQEGQERSTETNRCRTITKMPHTDYAVLGAETKNGGQWYVWVAVGGVLLLAVGYAVWEWHSEIGRFISTLRHRLIRLARLHK